MAPSLTYLVSCKKIRRKEALACFKLCKMKHKVKISLNNIDMIPKTVISILTGTKAISPAQQLSLKGKQEVAAMVLTSGFNTCPRHKYHKDQRTKEEKLATILLLLIERYLNKITMAMELEESNKPLSKIINLEEMLYHSLHASL